MSVFQIALCFQNNSGEFDKIKADKIISKTQAQDIYNEWVIVDNEIGDDNSDNDFIFVYRTEKENSDGNNKIIELSIFDSTVKS